MSIKPRLLLITLSVALIALLAIMTKSHHRKENVEDRIVVAKAWKNSPNHSGIYVAIEKGFFKEQNINVKFYSFGSVRSEKLLSVGRADVAFLPAEDLMLVNEKDDIDVTAIASVLSENPQFIAVKTFHGIFEPRNFVNKSYVSHAKYASRYLLNAIIKNDGGVGRVIPFRIRSYGLAVFLENRIDLLWGFENFEGIALKEKDLDINYFYLKSYGLGNYGTPLLAVNTEALEIEENVALYERFLKAAQRGYEWAAQNPEETVDIVIKQISKGSIADKNLFLKQQKATSDLYLTDGVWGKINEKELNILKDYLITNGIAESKDSLKYSNFFFEPSPSAIPK